MDLLNNNFPVIIDLSKPINYSMLKTQNGYVRINGATFISDEYRIDGLDEGEVIFNYILETII